jgi:hypothetical protein
MALSCHLLGTSLQSKGGPYRDTGGSLKNRYAVHERDGQSDRPLRVSRQAVLLTGVEVRPHRRAGSGLSLDWFSRTGMRAEAADDAFRNGVLQEDGG